MVKGYEYEKDQYVVIDDEDIKKVAPEDRQGDGDSRVRQGDDVDPVYLESSYYMAPDEGGEKPYALLFEAMRESNYLRARQDRHAQPRARRDRAARRRACCSTPCTTQDEVRQVEEFRTDTSLVKDKELDMAKMLIESLEGRVRAAEIPRHLPRKPAADDRSQDRRATRWWRRRRRTSRR
jgi:DNA end-binding protein Ku